MAIHKGAFNMKKIIVLTVLLSLVVLAGCCGIPDAPGPLGIPGV